MGAEGGRREAGNMQHAGAAVTQGGGRTEPAAAGQTCPAGVVHARRGWDACRTARGQEHAPHAADEACTRTRGTRALRARRHACEHGDRTE
eukprot:6192603-Pleurochrysis_carterae.AAC.4